MITTLDVVVLVTYLVGVTIFGIVAGGRQRSGTDYFLGGRDLPWWAICFSIVATETSTLTVIGIPAVSYLGGLAFFQLTLGYLVGRIGVAILLVPRFHEGTLVSAYGLLGKRFGNRLRASVSVTFMVTRLLADGVRLFASAIPIKVIAQSAGWGLSYFEIIVAIGLVTIAYTYVGGIRAVIWMDVVQMILYVGGAILAVFLLFGAIDLSTLSDVLGTEKGRVFYWGSDLDLRSWIAEPYTFVTAVVGGGIFSLASHGTDQLIVQRLLACRNAKDSQTAVIGSAVLVMIQFAVFLLVGLLLWVYYGGAALSDLGLSRGDEVFPKFIIEGMPPGISGLLIAGIMAAAMSTLSSSLNALAAASVSDVYERFRQNLSPGEVLKISRVFTLIWGLVFIVFANMFEDQTSPVVELGLAIASFTYGGMLGVFLLGIMNKHATERDAMIAFFCTIAVMVWVILGVGGVGWPWYTAIGAAILLLIGSALSMLSRKLGEKQVRPS
jgi:SSS family transporter